MANSVLNPAIIAKAAVRILDNELVMANQVYRGYEEEFAKKINGYDVGDTISVRKPTAFTVRNGAAASMQDVTEGKETFQINVQQGVDFKFTTSDLTLKIGDLAERVIRPAMIPLANAVDQALASLYAGVWNWIGTPGTPLQSFAGVAKAAERMDLTAVPTDTRMAVLSPTDNWAVAGSQTALYMQGIAQPAYRKGSIGTIAGLDTRMSQNVQAFTTGVRGGTPLVNGAAQNVLYTAVQNSEGSLGQQTFLTKGWTASVTNVVRAGDVFTIAGVNAVNPVTKAVLPYLQQFVVLANANSDGGGLATVTISPAIIASGAWQTVSAIPADSAALTFMGSANTAYNQNLAFHKNAFGLVVVPMVKPPGAVSCARQSYKGLSVRVIPYYDGTNDISQWRLDILYGVKTLDARLATRASGT